METFWEILGTGIAVLFALIGMTIFAMAPEILTILENHLSTKKVAKEESRILAAIDECIECEWKAHGSLVDEVGNRYWIDKFGNTVYPDMDSNSA